MVAKMVAEQEEAMPCIRLSAIASLTSRNEFQTKEVSTLRANDVISSRYVAWPLQQLVVLRPLPIVELVVKLSWLSNVA
jgi:hypothetical protein